MDNFFESISLVYIKLFRHYKFFNFLELILFLKIKLMEQEILKKLEEQEQKIDAIYKSVEKLRKYFLWTLIVTVVTIVLPLIALVSIIPWFLSTMTSAYNIQ